LVEYAVFARGAAEERGLLGREHGFEDDVSVVVILLDLFGRELCHAALLGCAWANARQGPVYARDFRDVEMLAGADSGMRVCIRYSETGCSNCSTSSSCSERMSR